MGWQAEILSFVTKCGLTRKTRGDGEREKLEADEEASVGTCNA
jgi:hypothetical protein